MVYTRIAAHLCGSLSHSSLSSTVYLAKATAPDRRSRNNEGWMADLAQHNVSGAHVGETRRDFLILTASAGGPRRARPAVWPFHHHLHPGRRNPALAAIPGALAPRQGSP